MRVYRTIISSLIPFCLCSQEIPFFPSISIPLQIYPYLQDPLQNPLAPEETAENDSPEELQEETSEEYFSESPPETSPPLPVIVVPCTPCLEEAPCCCPQVGFPYPKRLTLSHNTGWGNNSGIAQGSNYSTFGIFLAPNYVVGSFYPLVDLRASRFDNDSYAFNIGAGGRYIPCPNTFCEILGFNVFYDWRQGCLNEYNQLGIGLEILGRRWDFRANGYFPVGAKTFQVTCKYEYEGGYEITHQRKEITTYGFNAEVGWLAICSENFILYAAAGPYYLTRNSCCFEPIRGGRVRLRPQYRDYFAAEGSYSYDSNFNSIWELTFFVYLPLYQISNQNESCCLSDRQIYQPIERFEIMPLGKRSCWKTNF